MIANNLTNKIHKSWINFMGKEYIDTPIMNEYLQFKENDNHFKWSELFKPNNVVGIIIFSNKPKNSYSIPLCGKNTWEQKRFFEATGLKINKYELLKMNKYSAWFLKIIFNAYSRNKKTNIKCLIIDYVIEKYGIDYAYMKYLNDSKGFNSYNKLLKNKINWVQPCRSNDY